MGIFGEESLLWLFQYETGIVILERVVRMICTKMAPQGLPELFVCSGNECIGRCWERRQV